MCCKCQIPHSESAHGKIGIYTLSQWRQSFGTFDLCKDEVNDQPDRPQSGLSVDLCLASFLAAGARHECSPALHAHVAVTRYPRLKTTCSGNRSGRLRTTKWLKDGFELLTQLNAKIHRPSLPAQ
jgi:hypothetical protein